MWYTTCSIYTVSLALQRLGTQFVYVGSVFDLKGPDIKAKTSPIHSTSLEMSEVSSAAYSTPLAK